LTAINEVGIMEHTGILGRLAAQRLRNPIRQILLERADGSDQRVINLADEELMALCACGNRRAMDVLVSRYHSKLLDFAYRHLGDRDRAADIAQMSFVRVIEAASTFQRKSSFKTWLYTITMNLIRDDFRRRNVRKESLVSEMDAMELLMEAKNRAITTMETSVVDRMAASEMWTAVDQLPEAQRSAVMLRFRHDLTYDEIAQVMGAPTGTVKSWIHFALKKLRGELRPPESEGRI
jgi:RNA polymerase sigma-70 factor (ECF subfamily)